VSAALDDACRALRDLCEGEGSINVDVRADGRVTIRRGSGQGHLLWLLHADLHADSALLRPSKALERRQAEIVALESAALKKAKEGAKK